MKVFKPSSEERQKTSIAIPNGFTAIGENAFKNCSKMESVTIPNSVTSIGNGAFCGCSGMTSVTIPNSVTAIGENAFGRCSGMTSVTIPNSVTSIGNGAFYGCSKMESVTIPNSVTSIGSDAFYRCSKMESVTIPNSVTAIGVEAFYGCSGMTSVTIPNSVTAIGVQAFYGCSKMESVTIPNSVTSIGENAFNGCSKMESIYIPHGGVKSVGSRAFGSITPTEIHADELLEFVIGSKNPQLDQLDQLLLKRPLLLYHENVDRLQFSNDKKWNASMALVANQQLEPSKRIELLNRLLSSKAINDDTMRDMLTHLAEPSGATGKNLLHGAIDTRSKDLLDCVLNAPLIKTDNLLKCRLLLADFDTAQGTYDTVLDYAVACAQDDDGAANTEDSISTLIRHHIKSAVAQGLHACLQGPILSDQDRRLISRFVDVAKREPPIAIDYEYRSGPHRSTIFLQAVQLGDLDIVQELLSIGHPDGRTLPSGSNTACDIHAVCYVKDVASDCGALHLCAIANTDTHAKIANLLINNWGLHRELKVKAIQQWSAIQDMSTKRSFLGVTVLDGKLYAVGGNDGSNNHKSAEVYDPDTKQWSAIPDMSTKRYGLGVTVLDGKLYAVGGHDGSYRLKSAEVLSHAQKRPIDLIMLQDVNGISSPTRSVLEMGEEKYYPKETLRQYCMDINSYGNIERVKRLLQNPLQAKEAFSTDGDDGESSMHLAVKCGSVDLLEVLLLHSQDTVNSVDSNGQTPLHLAVNADSVQLVQLLLQAGANANVTDKKGHSPVSLSSFSMKNLIEKSTGDGTRRRIAAPPLRSVRSAAQPARPPQAFKVSADMAKRLEEARAVQFDKVADQVSQVSSKSDPQIAKLLHAMQSTIVNLSKELDLNKAELLGHQQWADEMLRAQDATIEKLENDLKSSLSNGIAPEVKSMKAQLMKSQEMVEMLNTELCGPSTEDGFGGFDEPDGSEGRIPKLESRFADLECQVNDKLQQIGSLPPVTAQDTSVLSPSDIEIINDTVSEANRAEMSRLELRLNKLEASTDEYKAVMEEHTKLNQQAHVEMSNAVTGLLSDNNSKQLDLEEKLQALRAQEQSGDHTVQGKISELANELSDLKRRVSELSSIVFPMWLQFEEEEQMKRDLELIKKSPKLYEFWKGLQKMNNIFDVLRLQELNVKTNGDGKKSKTESGAEAIGEILSFGVNIFAPGIGSILNAGLQCAVTLWGAAGKKKRKNIDPAELGKKIKGSDMQHNELIAVVNKFSVMLAIQFKVQIERLEMESVVLFSRWVLNVVFFSWCFDSSKSDWTLGEMPLQLCNQVEFVVTNQGFQIDPKDFSYSSRNDETKKKKEAQQQRAFLNTLRNPENKTYISSWELTYVGRKTHPIDLLAGIGYEVEINTSDFTSMEKADEEAGNFLPNRKIKKRFAKKMRGEALDEPSFGWCQLRPSMYRLEDNTNTLRRTTTLSTNTYLTYPPDAYEENFDGFSF